MSRKHLRRSRQRSSKGRDFQCA